MEKEKLEAAKQFLSGKSQLEATVTNLIYDGQQYSIKIPKEFMKKLHIEGKHKEYQFEFVLEKNPLESEEEPMLIGILVGKNEKEYSQ